MASIKELQGCAEHHLDHYMSPLSTRSFLTYDIQGDPRVFGPVDALAPTFLAARVNQIAIKNLFRSDSDFGYLALRKNIDVLLHMAATTPSETGDTDFLVSEPSEVWSQVQACFDIASRGKAKHIRAVMLSKMLHRKLPDLIPIVDSQVTAFYGVGSQNPFPFFEKLRADIHENLPWLLELRGQRTTPDGRLLSILRLADIVIWEHRVTKCQHPHGPSAVCGYPNDCRFCYPGTGS